MSNICLEENKSFSQSMLWASQRAFYHEKGIEAWSGDVPFYITSNPYIANTYASIFIRFIQDWLKRHTAAADHPFYILELGVGSGQFSFYFLKQLEILQKKFGLESIKIRYIMSDFTKSNIQFWQQQPALLNFVENGMLDFATYDLEKDKDITLYLSQKKLSQACQPNPLTVFANYIFDSIVSDIFYVKDNTMHESTISLFTKKDNLNKYNLPINWEKLDVKHQERIAKKNHYPEKVFNTILADYKQKLDDSFLLFPTGGLRAIENLNKIANNQLLMISSDKAYCQFDELEDMEFPELDFHGSFSTMVNYHAIAEYFKHIGGDAFLQSPRDSLNTVVFANGFKFNELIETQRIIQEKVEAFSPTDYFNCYDHFDETYEKASLNALASYLALSRWDAFVFSQVSERLIDLFEEDNSEAIDYILDHIDEITNNFYYVPECDDIFFSIGQLYYAMDDFDNAIKYYQLSEKYFEVCFQSTYNIALCYYYAEKYQSAIDYFSKAKTFKPRHKELGKLLGTAKRKLKKKI